MERFLEYFEPEKYHLGLKIDKNAKKIGASEGRNFEVSCGEF